MKRLLITGILIVSALSVFSQTITLSSEIKVRQEADLIILKGDKVHLISTNITCDTLVVDATVTKIQIDGNCRISVGKLIINHNTNGIEILKSQGILYLETPNESPKIIFDNKFAESLEVKFVRMD